MDTSVSKSASDTLADLLDKQTAANLLGVTARTLDRWHREQAGPPRIRLGRKIRYRRHSLENWVCGLEAQASAIT
jgi:predicted DNA-binding transcriptional regulator AlpA